MSFAERCNEMFRRAIAWHRQRVAANPVPYKRAAAENDATP